MADWGTVDKIRERRKLTDKGELIKVFAIEATTAKGISFTTDILAEELEEEAVNKVLAARATELDKLLEL